MTGELLSLELIELKIFEHFMLLRNLEEIKIHDLANSKVKFGTNLYVNHKGASSKYTVLGQSGRSMRIKLEGHMKVNWTFKMKLYGILEERKYSFRMIRANGLDRSF